MKGASRVLKQDDIDSILELADIEADRWGHKSANLAHVAYVMATVFRKEFTLHFGKFGRVLLEELLRSNTNPAGIGKAKTLLVSAESIDDAVLVLHQFLSFPEVMTDDMELGAHDRWLISQIEDRFRAYGRRPSNETLDELYVLIASLKVVGLDESHEAMKARLIELRDKRSVP